METRHRQYCFTTTTMILEMRAILQHNTSYEERARLLCDFEHQREVAVTPMQFSHHDQTCTGLSEPAFVH